VLIARERGALKLADCDERALALGLSPGMTLADARARIPDLISFEAQPEADRMLLERLAAYCDRFTPLVALDPPHGLVLDITGCSRLFTQGELVSLLERRLAAAGLGLRCAIAGTPEAARAVARFGGGGIVPRGAEEAAVRPLPAAALELPAETVIALSRAGLKTVGDVADRAPAALTARFGAGLAARLPRILGHEDIRISPLRPVPDCVVEQHFPEPLLNAASLEVVVTRLITEAASLLERRGMGGRVFEISFFRSDGAVRRLVIETGRPSRDTAALLRLWRERIDSLADPIDPGFGFDAVKLAVSVCETLNTVQTSLDGQSGDDDAVAALVDRLVTRFGRGRVLRFIAQDTHDPRHEARSVPVTSGVAALAVAWPALEANAPPARPLHLFEPPQPVETLAEVPDGPPLRFRWRRVLHEIARAEGPERIAPEWWQDGPHPPIRDYYRVEDAQGRRFWLFRAGLYEQGSEPPRWFLHGVFA
jgi:protein ImuB